MRTAGEKYKSVINIPDAKKSTHALMFDDCDVVRLCQIYSLKATAMEHITGDACPPMIAPRSCL